MRYIDGFRDAETAERLVRRIAKQGRELSAIGRRVRIMEVCGSHTMAIGRYGIRSLLPESVELISGPGCPVCVTDPGYIDAAAELAGRGAVVVTFGDMLRVPGSGSDLAACRAGGGDVRSCYSPASALEIARAEPGREVVFLAIGFETTTAPVTSLVAGAVREGLRNLFLLTAFKTVPPALEALLSDPETAIDAFLCPAHVSAIIGAKVYEPVAARFRVPCVIAGFEPVDILFGISGILAQVMNNEAKVDNQYKRVARAEGNVIARALIARYLEPVDALWRGIGVIPQSGLGLKEEFSGYDAERGLGVRIKPGSSRPGCVCGDVIKGKRRPADCALFGAACTPDEPAGPCMVSAEGTCAAAYRYDLPGGRVCGSA